MGLLNNTSYSNIRNIIMSNGKGFLSTFKEVASEILNNPRNIVPAIAEFVQVEIFGGVVSAGAGLATSLVFGEVSKLVTNINTANEVGVLTGATAALAVMAHCSYRVCMMQEKS